jgi:hypothetical protein
MQDGDGRKKKNAHPAVAKCASYLLMLPARSGRAANLRPWLAYAAQGGCGLMGRDRLVAALVLADDQLRRLECLLEQVYATAWTVFTAQEHVKRSGARFRVRVYRHMATIQHGDGGNVAARCRLRHVHVQQGRPRDIHTTAKRLLDVLGIIQPACAEQIHDEMTSGDAGATPLLEPLDTRLPRGHRADWPHDMCGVTMVFLLGGA